MILAVAIALAVLVLGVAIDLLVFEPRRLRGMAEYARNLSENGPPEELSGSGGDASETAESDPGPDALE